MRVLVTGGSGYFGSLLAQKLSKQGFACRIFDINPPADAPCGAEFIQGDIRDEASVTKACAGADVVYHNVAQVPLAKDRLQFESVNIGGMANLLAAARKNGVRKVVYTSSSAVFGVPSVLPVTENTPPAPREAYGAAKARAEELCKESAGGGMEIAIVRPRTILGHGRLGIFQILFEWINEGRKIPVMGRGDNVYQFVHADDLAEICIRAGERTADGGAGFSIYNAGAASYGTMRAMLEALCARAGTGARVYGIPMKLCKTGMKITSKLGLSPLGDYHTLMYGESMYFDLTKVRTELDYVPRYSNEQAICESYDWYLANKESISLAGGGMSAHRSAVKQGVLKLIKLLS